MGYDFGKCLFKGEQILWTGESSPNAPSADKYRKRYDRMLCLLAFVIGGLLLFAAISHGYTGTDLAGALFLAAIFIAIGIWLWKSTVKYTQEYYCLTDKRLMIKHDKGNLDYHELYDVQTAEVTARKGEYGSIVVFSVHVDIKKYKRQNYGRNQARPSKNDIWCIRGVTECDMVCNAIINASAGLSADRENQIKLALQRELPEGYEMSEAEAAANDALKKKLHKRLEKMQKRYEKAQRKNGDKV